MDRAKRISLISRIFIMVYVTIVIFIAIIATLIFTASFSETINREFNRSLAEQKMFSNAMKIYAQRYFQFDEEKLNKSVIQSYTDFYMDRFTTLSISEQSEKEIFSNLQINASYLPKIKSHLNSKRSYMLLENSGRKIIYVTSLEKINNTNYQIKYERDVTGTLEDERIMVRKISIFIGAMLFLLAIILFILLKKALNPLRKLSTQAQEISKGNYQERIEVFSNDEMGKLAENFNLMAGTIEGRIAALNRAAKDREDFIANLAHELKTPITSISGYADLCVSGKLSSEKHLKALDFIRKESKRIDEMSSKLLNLFRVSNGNTIYKNDSQLTSIINHVKYMINSKFYEKGLALEVNTQVDRVFVDETLFISLLSNLLTNACKASLDGGKIELAVWEESDMIVLCVTDYGVGINKEDLDHILEPFYIVDKSRTSSSENTGLGLALCDAIAKLHDGALSITSKIGEGTRVYIKIPKQD